MNFTLESLPECNIIHNRGCGINYLQRRGKIPYSSVPADSWFLQEKLCDKIAIDIPWSMIEPEEGRYLWEQPDWEGCFKSWIDAGFKILLKIRGMDTLGTFYNQGTPQWVFDAGAQYVDESIAAYRNSWLLNDIPENQQMPIRYPVYWDCIYIEKATRLINAMGKRYNGHPAIESVAIAHTGRWGEMHIADHQPLDPWIAKGYSIKNFLWGHRQIIEAYLQAFPDTQLQQSIGAPSFHDELEDAMESFDYLAQHGVMLKYGGLGKSWRPSRSPYLDEDVMSVLTRYKMKSKVVFENLVLPEALQLGLDMNMSYWQRGGEAAGLGIMNVEKSIPIKDKRIYSMYSFFSDEYEKLSIDDEKNMWRNLARKCGYRLGLREVDVSEMHPGKTFTTHMSWLNSGSAACYEKFKICLFLNDTYGNEIWREEQTPSCGCNAETWDSGKDIDVVQKWHLPSEFPIGTYELSCGLKHERFNGDMMRLANGACNNKGNCRCGIVCIR